MRERGTYGEALVPFYHESDYLEITTILDYEVQMNIYLYELVLRSKYKGKKVLDIDDNGIIVLGCNSYTKVSQDLEDAANCFLQRRKEIVKNSFLADTEKNTILLKGRGGAP